MKGPAMRNAEKALIVLLLLLITAFVCGDAAAEKRIGILMFTDVPRNNATQRGFVEQLKKEGFGAPAVKFIIGKAGTKKARQAELVEKFAAAKLDLIFALGTPAAIAAAKEIKDVPIVGMVYDPVGSKLSASWKSSGNNTTGVASWIPMSKLMDRLKEFMPVKKLAVLYTPGEKNSEAIRKELEAIQHAYNIRIVPVPLTREEEIMQILPEVIRTSDAIYLTGSSIVGKNIPLIVDMSTKAKKATITHLDDFADLGVLLSVSASHYELGLLAGKKAASILRGTKPSSIPYESLKKFDLTLNMKTARAGQFQIPPAFMKKVTKTIK
jgi:putative tryptophan/tyrosine transport system substrate-binding protein